MDTPSQEIPFQHSQIVERGGQLFELVVEGTIEVIPGPLSRIRAICEQVIDDSEGAPPSWPGEILAIVEREA